MHEAIERLRSRMNPVREGRYLLGFSGGADSTALLLMLEAVIREGRITAEAIHINHGLRGVESDGDERFCRQLCAEAGIPISVYYADLGDRTDEASARKARFGFFRQRYEETGADAVILAHNADDQAETFLMRLMRGAGPTGIECMKEEDTVNGIRILRPMLSMRRSEIRAALRSDGQQWREDSSNRDSAYLRNRVRKELIPMMEQISGTAVERICNTAALIRKDNEALDAQAEVLFTRLSDGPLMNAEALAEAPEALRSRTLRMWWHTLAPGLKEHALSSAQTEAFEKMLHTARGKINLPGGVYAIRNGKYLFLRDGTEKPPEPVKVTGTETVFGPFCLIRSTSEGAPGDGKTIQEVPEGFTEGCVIRTRRDGDRIRPFGSSGSRKLQDYLTDRKIAEPFRDQIPLLCRGNEVLLVCGVGAGDIPAWNRNTPHVRLTWLGNIPWMEKQKGN